LTTGNFLRRNPMGKPAFLAPDWQFCAGLNAPAALARDWLIRTTNGWRWGHPILWTILFFLLVWLLWYLVSIEIGGNGHSILTPKTGTRSVADFLLVVCGAAVGIGGLDVRRHLGLPVTYPNLVALLYFLWGAAISVFYGHDLWLSVGAVARERAARADKRSVH